MPHWGLEGLPAKDVDAVATYVGNPTVHNHGLMLFVPPLLRTTVIGAVTAGTGVTGLRWFCGIAG